MLGSRGGGANEVGRGWFICCAVTGVKGDWYEGTATAGGLWTGGGRGAGEAVE